VRCAGGAVGVGVEETIDDTDVVVTERREITAKYTQVNDGRLREVRVLVADDRVGLKTANVRMLMESVRGKGDARRLFAYHHVWRSRIDRDAFDVVARELSSVMNISYLTPRGRYHYRRAEGVDK
jgi:hypothetical protein